MRIAVCAGSFDPVTLGHLDVIERAASCFDWVYVCVSPNAEKRGQMFTPEQKLRLVQTAVAHLPNVTAELYNGLLADYAKERGAAAIVRGIRNAGDFDGEYQLAMVNRSIYPELETYFLPAAPEYVYLSSTVAREMIRYRQPLEKYLPRPILPLIKDWTGWREGE
ncbi:MAG: pantetheine-phosphate adenylyltransferase [Oscillibacter sp.]|nr:pantetheine-phosphate adenylyltransferase [Oscillibacter sp.]